MFHLQIYLFHYWCYLSFSALFLFHYWCYLSFSALFLFHCWHASFLFSALFLFHCWHASFLFLLFSCSIVGASFIFLLYSCSIVGASFLILLYSCSIVGMLALNSLTQLYRQVKVTCYISTLCRAGLFAEFTGIFLRNFVVFSCFSGSVFPCK